MDSAVIIHPGGGDICGTNTDKLHIAGGQAGGLNKSDRRIGGGPCHCSVHTQVGRNGGLDGLHSTDKTGDCRLDQSQTGHSIGFDQSERNINATTVTPDFPGVGGASLKIKAAHTTAAVLLPHVLGLTDNFEIDRIGTIVVGCIEGIRTRHRGSKLEGNGLTGVDCDGFGFADIESLRRYYSYHTGLGNAGVRSQRDGSGAGG